MKIDVNAVQLAAELDELAAAFSATELPAVTRIVFSEQDLAARRWFKSLCTAAGLSIREDAVGNTFARWQGSDPAAAAVGTGSHIDAIPHSGRFDGTVGVLGGLEAIRALQRAGFQPRRSIEVLLFTSEEPTRFGIGCLGSRLLCKSTPAAAGETLRDSDSRTLNDVRTAAGFTGSLDSVPLEPGYYYAFAELHIEQGPLLEQRNVPLGVVRAIAAPASLRITIEGQGGHAGAVLMPDRHDAFLAAAEIALSVELAARSTGFIDTVATTGMCEVFPGNINAIPSRVRISFDIRDTDEARRDSVLQSLEQACKDTEARRGVKTTIEPINCDAPCVCSPTVVKALTDACRKHDLPFDTMVSRAYHDSLFMSRICPTAMLFIPCRNGVSHRPDEYASPEDIARGTLVLAEALATLSA
jgi:N-carbamoyl-L-amino-acid hydrolase